MVGDVRHRSAHLKIGAYLQAHAQVVVTAGVTVAALGRDVQWILALPAVDRQARDSQAMQDQAAPTARLRSQT